PISNTPDPRSTRTLNSCMPAYTGYKIACEQIKEFHDHIDTRVINPGKNEQPSPVHLEHRKSTEPGRRAQRPGTGPKSPDALGQYGTCRRGYGKDRLRIGIRKIVACCLPGL